jgi:Fic family protein
MMEDFTRMFRGQESVFQVLASSEMRGILRRSRRAALLHADFLELPQPPGWDPEETWALLKAIQREYALEIPIPAPDGHRLCYFLHQDLINKLLDFERHCRAESELHVQLADREGQPFLVRVQAEEAIATSALDGVSIPYRQAVSLIRLDHKPRDGGERVIANTYRLMREVGAYVGRDFSSELLREFYLQVTDGVDPDTIPRGPLRSPLAYEHYRRLAEGQADRHLDEICAYANHESGDPEEHPVIRAFAIRGAMRQWLPLPDFNGNVASLMFRLYCLKHGYPVLSYLPFSRVVLYWQDGLIPPEQVPCCSLPLQYVDEHGDEDHTAHLTLAIQLGHREVMRLLAYVQTRRQQDERLVAALQSDPSLNHRQRSVVGRAIRRPEAEFSIGYHRTNHNVVYATARADLLDLVTKGYLVLHTRNRKFVFQPHPELPSRLRLTEDLQLFEEDPGDQANPWE